MKSIWIAYCLIICFYTPATSQNKLILDLATEPSGSLTMPLQEGKIILMIKNKLPDGNYSIQIDIEDEILNPLPSSAIENLTGEKTDYCAKIETVVKEIKALDEEALITDKRRELESYLESSTNCPNISIAEQMVKSFDLEYEVFDIKKSQTLKVIVKRTNKEGKVLEWTRIYKTPSRGKWLTSYSFNFITQWANKEHAFYSKSIGVDSFRITSESNRKWADFVPSVMFTWLPSKGLRQSWVFGWSGGVGFDLEKPVVFLGGSLIYNQNLSINLGVAAHQVKNLNGKYNEGDLIKENLSSDQLLISPYRVNPFVSISLRFDKNPFKIGKPADDDK